MCIRLGVCDFFFFKQKTAYEMRISDWSSDVCSSDLSSPRSVDVPLRSIATADNGTLPKGSRPRSSSLSASPRSRAASRWSLSERWSMRSSHPARSRARRSEEHTSELQSLMRISYAVFCLKHKQKQVTKQHTIH